MVINEPLHKTGHVKFVSYTGKYPNLCRGVLTLKINDITYTFGSDAECDYPDFWESGGACFYKAGQTELEEWLIDCGALPPSLQEYVYEIDLVFNENVPFGCCGGCL